MDRRVVTVLGGVKGWESRGGNSKRALCESLGVSWGGGDDGDDAPLLDNCVRYITLEQRGDSIDGGDHAIYTCEVIECRGEGDQHLTTATLRDENIITSKGRIADDVRCL